MTKYIRNKYTSVASFNISTLGDLHDFALNLDVPPSKKNPMRSAVKKVAELVGHGSMDFPANPQLILKQLDRWSPAMAGMSKGAFSNMKSRVLALLRLAEPQLVNPRSRYPLTGEWRALQETLDTGAQRNLSRLFHFADRQGWKPGDITDAHVERFTMHLRDEAMVGGWEDVTRNTVRAWNRLVPDGKHGALNPLVPPPAKRTPYWIPPDEWPRGLQTGADALLDRLANPNLFSGRKVRKLSPGTIEQYRSMISTLVSAAVGDGVPLVHLTSLAVALHPDHVARALAFLAARGGGTITATMMQMIIRVRVMADMCGLPPEQRDELDAIYYNLEQNAPPERKRRHMAPKNRVLLERIEHDKHFAALIYTLPDRLANEARVKKDRRSAPALMRTALAVHLLLTCSMRRENLVSLELGRSIKRIGQHPHHTWIIDLSPEEVKNGQELRHELEGPTAALLEEYLAEWRLQLCAKPNPWLFPGPDGDVIDPRTMAFAIQAQSKRVLGVPITPHQFRHISAESFLLAHPDKLDQISEHLGHRDRNTTRYYYARSKQKQASRAYRKHVLKLHDDATRFLARRGRKHRLPDRSDEL